jgi:hypothetical protein
VEDWAEIRRLHPWLLRARTCRGWHPLVPPHEPSGWSLCSCPTSCKLAACVVVSRSATTRWTLQLTASDGIADPGELFGHRPELTLEIYIVRLRAGRNDFRMALTSPIPSGP